MQLNKEEQKLVENIWDSIRKLNASMDEGYDIGISTEISVKKVASITEKAGKTQIDCKIYRNITLGYY